MEYRDPKTGMPYQSAFPQSSPMQPAGFRCPFCQSTAGTYVTEKISTQGWIVVLIMIFVCLPLFFIGLFMKEQSVHCRSCGMRLS